LESSPWHDAQTYPFLYAPTTRETQLVDAPDLNDELRARTLIEYRSYGFQGFPAAAYMYERDVRTQDEAEGSEEPTKTIEEHFDVDAHGLPNGYSRVVYGGSSWPIVSEYHVTSVRDADRTRWILDKFERVTETVNGASESIRYEHDDETGFVTQMTKQHNTTRQLVTVYTPDSFGNVATMTENGERLTQFDYGEAGIFLGVVQNAEGHSQTFGYDDALGLQTEKWNENGYGLIQEYDGFGRLVLQQLDNDGTKTTESEIVYSPVNPTEVDGQDIQSRVRLTITSDYSGERIQEFDSRGNLVRTQDPGLGVSGGSPDLVTEKTYDWAGRMTRSSQAHLASEAPDWTRISYDDRGRPTRVRSPQGDLRYRYASRTQYQDAYPEWVIDNGLELVHVTDQEGVERVLVTDEKGRNVLTAEGVDLASHDTGLISKVIYGAWDLPERLIDPELNETLHHYTDEQQLEWTEDANRGRASFAYDVYGNVVSEISADGVESEFSYDNINRLRTRIDHRAEGDQTSEWKYDQDVPGTLSEMIGPTGVKTEFEYEDDPRALQNLVRYTVGEETFTTETEYDSLGRSRRVVYPSISVSGDDFKFAVRPTYDGHSGRQIGVQSDDQATDYWKVQDVDYVTHSVVAGLGNGVVEERNYDPTSRRLASIRTEDEAGDQLSALTYQYFDNGQMRDRSFTHSGDTHVRSFTYDRALRLETVTDDGVDEQFEFSSAGRLLSRSKYGGYIYDAAQPHAVTSVGNNEFDYDERGNQYLRLGPDIPGTTQTTREFSRFNLPVQVDVGDPAAPEETLTYEYDAAGRRVAKRTEMGGVEVLTPGDLYQRQGEPGVEAYGLHTFRVFMEGREVLQVQFDSETEEFDYRYLHRDHLESVLYTTDEAGEQSEVRDFDVFGAPLSEPSWAGTTEEGYTGHKADPALGLLEAGVRMYDPKFGTFTTPDALRVSGAGSQAFNPFAYANNDPVNWYDPTGFAGEGVEEEVIVHGGRYDGYTALPGYWDFGGPEPNLIFQSVPSNADGDAARQQRLEDAYYGAGQYSSLHGLLPAFDQIEDTSPTWNAIGAYGTMALNVVNMAQGVRALATTAWRAVAGRVAAANAAGAAERALVPYFPAGNGLLGATSQTMLRQGQVIDRVGGSAISRFFSPAGTPLAARALPPGTSGPLQAFEVLKPFSVESGTVAPAFGQLGLGIQLRTSMTLGELIEQGFLRAVP